MISPRSMHKTAQVFEHGYLSIGEQGFLQHHFDGLVRYRERCSAPFYSVGYRRLQFSRYVGVIQIGDLIIEILPKAERAATADKGKWQKALIEMLRAVGLLKIEPIRDAYLRIKPSPLIDLYLEAFLKAVEELTHAGLAKKYRVTEANLHKMKGRILFRQQVAKNYLHAERVYTAHSIYDPDNIFNQILKRATTIVANISTRPSIAAKSRSIGLCFDEISDPKITSESFHRLKFDRNTERYRHAVELARLLILNYAPDIRGGGEHVISLMFDMNKLFERYVLVCLKRAEPFYEHLGLNILGQESRLFWLNRSIRPDILVQIGQANEHGKMIIDTKWKIPENNKPSDADLKQMFAYNVHFGVQSSVLVYPQPGGREGAAKEFAHSAAFGVPYFHDCRMHYVDLFDASQELRKDLGKHLIESVILPFCGG